MQREIRQFSPDDAAGIAEMFNQWDPVWPGSFTEGIPFTAERILEDHRRQRFIAKYIAFADGRPVGYCSLMQLVSEPNAAYVGLLGVSPDQHKQRFGRDLLRTALNRTIELGYARLDLGTWAGNLRAVPLYKKMGFFWVPDTQVQMQNYLPTILRTSWTREFLANADWYDCFRRDLAVRPDTYFEDGMKVYPYEFEREGRRLRVLIDPQSRGITGVETDRFAVACRVRGERFPSGMAVPVSWQIVNRQPQAGPLDAAIVARGEEGLSISLQTRVQVDQSETLLGAAVPARDATERPDELPAHRIQTTALLGDQVVELSTGLRLRQPIDVSVPDSCVYLRPGVTRRVALKLRSEIDAAVRVQVRLTAPAELLVEPATFEVALAPKALAGITTALTAAVEGAFELRACISIATPETTLELKPAIVPVHSVAPGGAVASFDDRRVFLTTEQVRVTVTRRGAGLDIADALSGRDLVTAARATIGPPFSPGEFDGRDFDVQIERRPGVVSATLSCASEVHPGVLFQHKVELPPGPAVRVWYRAINGSNTSSAFQVSSHYWLTPSADGNTAVPLAEGLVVDAAPEFPDWGDPALGKPERFAERWLAVEGDGLVGGLVWEAASAVDLRPHGGRVIFDLGSVAPSQAVDGPSVWVYAGPGDWRAVRGFWRERFSPDALPDRDDGSPRRALEVRLSPALAGTGVVALELSSLRQRKLSGTVELELPAELDASPGRFEFADLRRGAPWRADVQLAFPSDRAPRAYAGRARVRTDVWDVDLPVSVIEAGRPGERVTVTEEVIAGLRVLTIRNGYLTARVCPEFAGALYELSDGRTNHLQTAFPKPRPLAWMNPWFGGFQPTVSGAEGQDSPGYVEEAFRWTAAERDEDGGLRWRGIAVEANLNKPGLRGLSLRVEYLTLGGSNLIAVVGQLINPTGAPVAAVHGGTLYLAPGGTANNAVAHFARRGIWSHRRSTGFWEGVGRWVAVENPETEDVLVVAAPSRSTELHLLDEGEDGAHVEIGPSRAEQSAHRLPTVTAYLVLARGLEQARLYRALCGGN